MNWWFAKYIYIYIYILSGCNLKIVLVMGLIMIAIGACRVQMSSFKEGRSGARPVSLSQAVSLSFPKSALDSSALFYDDGSSHPGVIKPTDSHLFPPALHQWSIHHCIASPRHRFATAQLDHYTTALYWTTASVHRCTTARPDRYTTTQYWTILHHCTTEPLHHITILNYCTTSPSHCSTLAPLQRSTTAAIHILTLWIPCTWMEGESRVVESRVMESRVVTLPGGLVEALHWSDGVLEYLTSLHCIHWCDGVLEYLPPLHCIHWSDCVLETSLHCTVFEEFLEDCGWYRKARICSPIFNFKFGLFSQTSKVKVKNFWVIFFLRCNHE